MPLSVYHNFDLLITRSGDDYRAFVVDAPGGDADVTFALPFTANELDFLGDLAGARRGGAGGGSGTVPDLKELGSLLHAAVVQGKVAAVLATSLDRAAEERAGLRLRLRFSEETSELATLPWEILYDPVQERFLALSESSPILRYLSLPRARPTLLVEPPLRLLAVLVSPPGFEELDLEREWQVLESSLAGLVENGKFVVEQLAVPSLAALQQRLLGEDVHILHFVGHGVFDDESGEGSLVFADETGEARLVSGEALAQQLHNHRSLRLVYLNACQGALASYLTVFSGVAQTLVQQGVPAAVAMQAEITDEAAIQVSRTFYAALAEGYPVDAALTQARVAVAERSAEWAIPVLFSRSPDNRLFDVVEVLPAPDCPYPGMVPFSEKQADVFFGRDREIADAIERLRQHPFLTVIGPSGSGKSSLVYAGVIPKLRSTKRFGPGEWDVRVMRPSDSRTSEGKAAPMQALRVLLGLVSDEASALPPDWGELEGGNPKLLFIDQFEETFTLADGSQAQAFLDALNELIGQPNLYIILTVRADFYPELMACSLWQPIRANRLELTPLGDEELRAAILQPAAQVGVTIYEVLAERLVADAAGESGALPLVQEALVLLWEKVERRHLALAAYTAMAEGNRNGLQVAIDRRATTVYNNLPEAAQPIARRIFLRLVQFGEGRLDTRRQQTVDELRASGDDAQVFATTLDKLTANRLLTTSGEEGSIRRVDIAHEALIGGWGLLRRWIGERRTAEQTRRRLEENAARYVELERQGGLLDARELATATDWTTSPDSRELGVSPDLDALIEDSRNAVRKASLIRYGSLAAIVGLVVVALAVFAAFQNRLIDEQQQNATAQAVAAGEISLKATAEATALMAAQESAATAIAESTIARSRELAASSTLLREQQPNLLSASLLLAIESMRLSESVAGEDALRRSLALLPQMLLRTEHTQRVNSLAFSPDSTLLAIASGYIEYARMPSSTDEGLVQVWSLDQNQELFRRPYLDDFPSSVQFASVANEQLLPDIYAGSARIWNVSTGEELSRETTSFSDIPAESQLIIVEFGGAIGPSSIPGVIPSGWEQRLAELDNYYEIESKTISPKQNRLAIIASDGSVLILDTNTWRLLRRVEASGSITVVSFSPDERTIATGSENGVAQLWNISSGLELTRMPHSEEVSALAFSPDGQWLATGSLDGSAKVWATNAGQEMRTVQFDKAVKQVAISPDGSMTAVSGDDHITLLDEYGNAINQIMLNEITQYRQQLDFSPDSKWLVLEADSNVYVVSVESGDTIIIFPNALWGYNLSPDGKWLAVSNLDGEGSVEIWSTMDWDRSTSLNEMEGFDFSSDSEFFAGGKWSRDQRILYLWRVEDWSLIGKFEVPEDHWIHKLKISPDGQLIATGGGHPMSMEQQFLVTEVSSGNQLAYVEWKLGSEWSGTGEKWEIDFSPDSKFLTFGDSVWEARTGKQVIQLAPNDNLVFSPMGDWLTDGTNLWQVQTWKIAAILRQPGEISGSKFSHDGKFLLTGGVDGSLRIWSLNSETLLETACRRIPHNLSSAEWSQFGVGETYRLTCPDRPPHPDEVRQLIDRGRNLAWDKDQYGAIAMFQQVLSLDPYLAINAESIVREEMAMSLIVDGHNHLISGNLDDAIADYRHALELVPHLVDLDQILSEAEE